jgi:Family of unknown function (DUF6159)
MARARRGWTLAKDSWKVLREDRSLAIFPILSFFASIAVVILVVVPGAIGSEVADQDWIILPFLLVAYYLVTFATVYFNVALAGAAVQSLEGKDTTLADGMAIARERRGIIAKWALLQTFVGVVINVLENLLGDTVGSIVATIVGSVLNAAWAIATFFVVPVLALEGLTPGDALKRSGSIIKARWGEGLVGSGSIGLAIFFVAVIPVVGLYYVGGSLLGVSYAAGVVVLIVATAVLIAALVTGSALGIIFRVALFRFATTEQTAAGFADADLAGAFQPRGRRR